MQKKIKILDKEFELYLSSKQIQNRIKEIAKLLNEKFYNQTPLILSVLNGSLYFTSDLTAQLNFNIELSFIKTASYTGTKSSGKVNKLIGLDEIVKGKKIIVIEDIIDSGLTLKQILFWLRELEPEKIDIITLLYKPDSLKADISITYFGFEVPDNFYIGYGMDYKKQGRNLNDIYQIKNI